LFLPDGQIDDLALSALLPGLQGNQPRFSVARQNDFPEQIQTDLRCPEGMRKIFLFFRIEIRSRTVAVSPTEGRIMIVANAGWDAVDANSVRRA
jgi:hypothetical protein